jgi:heterodisulfide reductase subunit C
MTALQNPSLRQVVLNTTGQDLRHCQGCLLCDTSKVQDIDIPLGSLVQLVLMNDEEALSSRTLWSEPVLELARSACTRKFNLEQVILALRDEALRRGVED